MCFTIKLGFPKMFVMISNFLSKYLFKLNNFCFFEILTLIWSFLGKVLSSFLITLFCFLFLVILSFCSSFIEVSFLLAALVCKLIKGFGGLQFDKLRIIIIK